MNTARANYWFDAIQGRMGKIPREDITGGGIAPAATLTIFTKQIGKRKDWTIPVSFNRVQCTALPLLTRELLNLAPTARDLLLTLLDYREEHESAHSLRSRRGLPHGGLENLFLNMYFDCETLEKEEHIGYAYPTSGGVEMHRDDHASHGAVIMSFTDHEASGMLYTASFPDGKRVSIPLLAGDAVAISRSQLHGVTVAKRKRKRLVAGFFF
jgi:hypothetical protein